MLWEPSVHLEGQTKLAAMMTCFGEVGKQREPSLQETTAHSHLQLKILLQKTTKTIRKPSSPLWQETRGKEWEVEILKTVESLWHVCKAPKYTDVIHHHQGQETEPKSKPCSLLVSGEAGALNYLSFLNVFSTCWRAHLWSGDTGKTKSKPSVDCVAFSIET